jgi:hypothetical protein
MSRPIAYNASGPLSGSIRGGTVNYTVDSGDRNYLAFAGKKWVPSADGVAPIVFVTDSYTRGYELDPNQSTPLFFACDGTGSADIIYTANRLPGSPGNYIDADVALESLVRTHGYFILESNDPFQGIDADSLVLDLDASKMSSYPQTGTKWRDLSGQGSDGSLINGTTLDPNGWLTFDGIDDYISIPNDYSFTTGNGTDYTFEIWFKMRTLPTIQYGPNGHVWGGQNGNNVVMYLNPESGGVSKGIMVYDDTRYLSSMMTNGGFTADTWAQWVIIGDGTNNTVSHYINGVLDKDAGAVSPSTQYVKQWGLGQTKLGFDTRWNTYSTLDIAIARQYTRQLSPTEIKQNYFGSPIVTDGLVFAVDAGNLVSYPKSGTAAYDLTGNNNGTLINGVGFSSENGGGWVFDGVDDYIGTNNLGLSSHTIEGWFNSNVTQGGGSFSTIVNILGNYGAGSDKYSMIGLIPSLTFRIDDGVNSFRLIAETSYSTNTWYHVALTYNSSNGITRAYVNGSDIGGITSTSGITFNSIPFNIAKTEAPVYFNGSVSLARVYDKALTAAEVQQNYQAEQYRF